MYNRFYSVVGLFLAVALLLPVMLCGCENAGNNLSSGSAAEGSVTLTDGVGREITVQPGSYQRVVCIGAGALRMYTYVGDCNLLCGVEDIDNTSLANRPQMFDNVARPYVLAYEELFSSLPSCGVGGPNAQTAEAEKILSCDPDIVISEYEDADKADALESQLGVPVVTLQAGNNGVFDEAFSFSMELLGKIFAREEKTKTLLDFIAAEKEEITARVASVSSGEASPAVYIGGLGNWGTTDYLYTTGQYAAFEVAGIRNAVTDIGTPGVTRLDKEYFTSLGETTDILILDAAAIKNIQPLYEEDPALLDCCRAWQEGEAYLQMSYNAYYTNYEIALANTWFAASVVYPEAFQDVDIKEKTDEITRAFLGKELAEEIYSLPMSYGGYQKLDTKTFFAG